MSQKNNLNMDKILDQIKSLPQKLKNDNWNEISSDKINIYKEVISVFEKDNTGQMILYQTSAATKSLFDYFDCKNQSGNKNKNVVKLDIKIVIKFVDKFLNEVKYKDLNNEAENNGIYLFVVLATLVSCRKLRGDKFSVQDVKWCADLCKITLSTDRIKKNIVVLNCVSSILNAILNATVYSLGESTNQDLILLVTSYFELVKNCYKMKWSNAVACSVLRALRSISEKSESLSSEQATEIFDMTKTSVGKITNWDTLDSKFVYMVLICPLKNMLCKKNNPAKIDVNQCLSWVKCILNENYKLDNSDLSALIKAIIQIVSYYGRDKECVKDIRDIEEYGFSIKNGEIMSFDEIKLKKFVSEKMFDTFENYLRNELWVISVNENKITDKGKNKQVNNQPVHTGNQDNSNNFKQPNVDMPLDSQNLSEVQQKTFDNNDMAEAERERSTSFDRSRKASDTMNNIKVVSWPKKQEGLSNSNPSKQQHKNEAQKDENKPIDGFHQNDQLLETSFWRNVNDFKQPEKEKGEGESIKTQSDPKPNEKNETNEAQKDEDEYKPTKMFAILAVLSLFIPFIPGLIFVIMSNDQKERPLIKFLVFVPIVSPIVLGRETYQVYKANKVLEAKEALTRTKPDISNLDDKANNFQNMQDMQAQKSKYNENEKNDGTKGISALTTNDAK